MASRKRSELEPAEAVNEAAAEGQSDESGIYLDPKLAEIRDAEAKRNDVEIAPREESSIDDALVQAREAEIKRGPRTVS